MEISGPTGFQHHCHIGWDPKAGFETRNIPAEWKALFKSAGVTKAELKDPETAKFIMDNIAEEVTRQGGTPPAPMAPQPPARNVPPRAPQAAPAQVHGKEIKGKEMKKDERLKIARILSLCTGCTDPAARCPAKTRAGSARPYATK
jgi:hypothetical protein